MLLKTHILTASRASFCNEKELLQSAASSGSVAALNTLGNCFSTGEGMERGEVQAVQYYKMAAESGHLEDLSRRRLYWLFGWGVEMNSDYGLILLQTAKDIGSKAAVTHLCNCSSGGHVF